MTNSKKLADEALKKATNESDKLNEEERKRQDELTAILRESADRVTIARAQASGNASSKIIADEQKILDDAIIKATARGATEKDLQQLRIDANQAAQDKIVNLQREQLKKTQDEIKGEAGRLFDALISGSKNFGQAIKQTLLGLALTPVKLVFEAVATAIFTPIVAGVKKYLASIGEDLKKKGGILGDIGKALSPDDKVIQNTQITDLNTKATQLNTDALKGLTGVLGGGGNPANTSGTTSSGGGLGNFGTIFGGATSPGSVIFNGLPSQGGFGGAAASIGAGFASFIPGIAELATAHGSTAVRIGGGLSLAGASLNKIGNVLGPSNPALGKVLGKAGGIIGGIGDFVSGVSQGGLQGTLEATIGGAEIGTAILPGIGTAIGAAVGFVAGAIRSLFGTETRQQKIAKAIQRQTLSSNLFSGNAFLGQSFARSAQNSFAKTVGSTFSEGPGGVFSSTSLANAPAPVVSPTFVVNAMDSKGVQEFFQIHGTRVSQIISGMVNSSNSGLARAARIAVSPA